MLCFRNSILILRQPLLACDKHFIDELPYFFRVAYGSDQWIHHECLTKQLVISTHSSLYSKPLYRDTSSTNGCWTKRQVPDHWHRYSITIDISRSFNNGIRRQVRNNTFILHIKMSTIHSTCFKRFDNV